MKLIKKTRAFGLFLVCMSVLITDVYADSDEDYTPYCEAAGGQVEQMPAKINMEIGFTKSFCHFTLKNASVLIGLETFASDFPNIAATYMKNLKEITPDSPLWNGNSSNKALNLCKNLGGAEIGFVAGGGGFVDALGESDVCVFGDGSMVSSWSLYYMTSHREGYDAIKDHVKSHPLSIPMP